MIKGQVAQRTEKRREETMSEVLKEFHEGFVNCVWRSNKLYLIYEGGTCPEWRIKALFSGWHLTRSHSLEWKSYTSLGWFDKKSSEQISWTVSAHPLLYILDLLPDIVASPLLRYLRNTRQQNQNTQKKKVSPGLIFVYFIGPAIFVTTRRRLPSR